MIFNTFAVAKKPNKAGFEQNEIDIHDDYALVLLQHWFDDRADKWFRQQTGHFVPGHFPAAPHLQTLAWGDTITRTLIPSSESAA